MQTTTVTASRVSKSEKQAAGTINGNDLITNTEELQGPEYDAAATIFQDSYRARRARLDFRQLCKQGCSYEAYQFMSAKNAAMAVQQVKQIDPQVARVLKAPQGALLAIIHFSQTFGDNALTYFSNLASFFLKYSKADILLGIIAQAMFIFLAGATFMTPLFASLMIRFTFGSGSGQIEIDQVVKWLTLFSVLTLVVYNMAEALLCLQRTRFATAASTTITDTSVAHGKLISKAGGPFNPLGLLLATV